MNYRLIIFYISVIVAGVGANECAAGIVSFLCGDSADAVRDLLICASSVLAVGIAGCIASKPSSEQQRKAGFREGYAIAGFGWIAASVTGALPFIFVSKLFWFDALFESFSGFTTTGSALIHPGMIMSNGSALPDGVESLSFGILFWRCLESWLGGMGIVVLALAILPMFNRGGQMLYNAETPGLKSSDTQIAPRITSSAKILWLVYVGVTLLEILLLRLAGMNFFDAVCNSFTTISTSGFCTKQASIAYFNSTPITLIITFFMFISGANFYLHVRFLSGRPLPYFKDEEFRFYSILLAGASCIIAVALLLQGTDYNLNTAQCAWDNICTTGRAFRDASFQATSIMTSTGFTIADYGAWPSIAAVLLLLLTLIGGCGGSTAGGLKCVRALLVWRQSQAEIRRSIFPQLVTSVFLNGLRMKSSTIQKTLAFFTMYIGTILFFAILIPLVCPDASWETAFSASLTCLSNTGPGFADVGPACNFDWLTPAAKLILAFEMMIGRLELFTVLVLFLPSFWRK